MRTPATLSRRSFFGAAGVASAGVAMAAQSAEAAPATRRAARPKPSYRVWFQPEFFAREMDLYAHMTVDASGWIDPRLADLAGRTTLDWVYGPNHPSATGPDYWRDACSVAQRTRPGRGDRPGFVTAGIAIDEWVPPALPRNVAWLCAGLREGRKANPDVFIAVWSTDPTAELIELGRDGTVDLFIVEGYTHSVEKGLSTSWENALRRTAAFAEGGVIEKTIFSFGHITAEKSHRGDHLQGAWLRERAGEIKRLHPAMPGVGFFEPNCPYTPEQRELVRFCDRLSAELWP